MPPLPNTPVNPLPNPGEGGPLPPFPTVPSFPPPRPFPQEPGGIISGIIGTICPNCPSIGFPLPNPPCFFCDGPSGGRARVRFLNAASGYPNFRIFINNRLVTSGLGFATLTPYGQVGSGFQTVSVVGPDGYIYIQKSMPMRSNETMTMAVINTVSGLDLMEISDASCNRPNGMSCFRVANLAINSRPLDVILYDGRVVYTDVRYKEVTSFKRVRPGNYQFYLAETSLRPTPRVVDIETISPDSRAFEELPEVLVSFFVNIRPNADYTVYILNPDRNSSLVQTLIVEDR